MMENVLIELQYFLWDAFALFDRVFGVSHYWEMQTSDYKLAEYYLSRYVVMLINYFEDAPFSESKKNIEVMQRLIENANERLRDINFRPSKLLETLTHETWMIFDNGWKEYWDNNTLNPSKKHYFDITSSEIRHFLYKDDCCEHFLWSDLFLIVEIRQGKVQVKLDVDSLEMRRSHEEEFNERKNKGPD